MSTGAEAAGEIVPFQRITLDGEPSVELIALDSKIIQSGKELCFSCHGDRL